MSLRLARMLCATVLLAVAACSSESGDPTAVETAVHRLEKLSGDKQSGTVGTQLPNELVVRVIDAEARPVSSQSVTFAVFSGGGTVSVVQATSDQNGIARARWTLGTSPLSAQQVSAGLVHPRTELLIHSVKFVATAQAGAAVTIEKVSGDRQSARPGEPLAGPLVVRLRDQHGNLKPTASVTWATLTGGGTPIPSISNSDGSGLAQTRFTLGSPLGEQTVRAALPTGQSVTFTATAATVTRPAGVIERTDPLGARPYGVAASNQDVVYVTQLDNQRMSRINLPTLGEAGSVLVGSIPTHVSFNASGTRAYVANQFSQNIGVVDVATNTQMSTIATTGDPFAVIPDAEDRRLYVVTNANRLYQFDRASGTVLASIAIAGTGQHLAFHPNGYLLYVGTFTGGTAIEVDTRSMTVTRMFVTGSKAQEVVVSADGAELFVADEDLQKVDIFNLTTGAKVTSVSVGGGPWAMAMTPDQSQLYVALVFQGEVVVIDRTTRTVVRRIATGGTPRRIVFNKFGTLAVVANESGFVTYIR